MVSLQRTFAEIHKATDPQMHGPKAHGLGVYLPVEEEAQPPIFITIVTHHSSSHATKTTADLVESFRRLKAPLSEFEIFSAGKDD